MKNNVRNSYFSHTNQKNKRNDFSFSSPIITRREIGIFGKWQSHTVRQELPVSNVPSSTREEISIRLEGEGLLEAWEQRRLILRAELCKIYTHNIMYIYSHSPLLSSINLICRARVGGGEGLGLYSSSNSVDG